MSTKILLAEVMDAAIRGVLADARTSLPGRVESYSADTGRAVVQILVMDASIADDGERVTETRAPLVDVPVLMPGSGSVRIKIPIRKGDPCWLSFSSSCIAKLKAGAAGPIDPGDDRHHHLADAVAIPMPRLTGDVEGETMIEFTDSGLIRAGGDEPLVTRTEFLAHTHATAGTGTPSPPISGSPGSAVTFPGTPKLRG